MFPGMSASGRGTLVCDSSQWGPVTSMVGRELQNPYTPAFRADSVLSDEKNTAACSTSCQNPADHHYKLFGSIGRCWWHYQNG